MITTLLVGRAGNQLFQSSAAIAYALDNDQEFHIPTITQNMQYWPPFLTTKKNKNFNSSLPSITIYEKGHEYNPLPSFDPEWKNMNVFLSGYFQSSKYFDHHRTEIIKLFNIPYEPLLDFVSIHVRRGDYLRFPDKHPTVTYEYLKAAVLHFVGIGYKSFIVCSDDIPWCKTALSPLRVISGAEFSYSENAKEVQDLALMSCCAHNIISNSSFSWWSHWLNRNPDKICIAPEAWFGPGNAHLKSFDIYPQNCIKL